MKKIYISYVIRDSSTDRDHLQTGGSVLNSFTGISIRDHAYRRKLISRISHKFTRIHGSPKFLHQSCIGESATFSSADETTDSGYIIVSKFFVVNI
jgi:hypothetical protein